MTFVLIKFRSDDFATDGLETSHVEITVIYRHDVRVFGRRGGITGNTLQEGYTE